jgi:hypothetical protein
MVSMVYLGFWGTMAVVTGLILLRRVLGAFFRYLWAILTWDGRLLDNPLFQNRLFQFNVSNFVKKGYARLITKN